MNNRLNWLYFMLIFNSFIICNEQIKKEKVNVTIFVHGTYPAGIRTLFRDFMHVPTKPTLVSSIHAKYPTLKSRFHYVRFIAKHLTKADGQQFPLEHFYAVGWSGQLNSQARLEGAKNVYEGLKLLYKDYNSKNIEPYFTLITHSHGGNVALNLAKIKDKSDKDLKVHRLILMGTPIQEETKNYAHDNLFEKIYNIYSSIDAIQILDPQGLHECNKDNKLCPMFSQRRLPIKENIKQAQLKINCVGLAHEDMLLPSFNKILPKLLVEMDNLEDCTTHYLIKAYTIKKKQWQVINMDKRIKYKKFGRKVKKD